MTETERRYYNDIHKIAGCLGAIQKTLERIERNTRPVELETTLAKFGFRLEFEKK